MKKFKFPLKIVGADSELLAIKKELISLGYIDNTVWYNGDFFNCLITNDAGISGHLCIYPELEVDKSLPRENVSASNKELVLALAAMVDDKEPHIGEYVIAGDNHSPLTPIGSLFRICQLIPRELRNTSFNVDGIECENPNGLTSFPYERKATKEEIIAHFTKKDSMNTQQAGYPGTWGSLTPDVSPTTTVSYTITSTVPTKEIDDEYRDVVKARLETLLLDKPELRESLAELFPEIISKITSFSRDNSQALFKTISGDEITMDIRKHGPMAYKAIGLNIDYNWEIIEDPANSENGERFLLLVPTRKK